jgi:hypothetical protein
MHNLFFICYLRVVTAVYFFVSRTTDESHRLAIIVAVGVNLRNS